MTKSPIDLNIFRELEETTGSDFVAELIDTFLLEAPGMLEQLKTAASGEDNEGYRRAAHSIKSNANIFGATELAELARGLELAGRAIDPEKMDAQHGALDTCYERTADSLRILKDG